MGEIFISHASADGVLAARVAEGVRLAGHGIFLDSDRKDGIVPGVAWQQTLFRELRICDAVVFLNSMAAQASMWCHSELVVAARRARGFIHSIWARALRRTRYYGRCRESGSTPPLTPAFGG